jgi:magnesium transporter
MEEVETLNQAYLLELNDADIAEYLERLTEEEQLTTFLSLPVETAANVSTFLPQELREFFWRQMEHEHLARILTEMDPDDRKYLLEAVEEERIPEILALIEFKDKRDTEVIFSHPPESVGRLMTPHFIKVRPEWSLEFVLQHLRKYGGVAETLEVLYVINSKGQLIDEVTLRDVLLTTPSSTVSTLMDNEVICINANDDQEEAVRIMEKYDKSVLPVVDGSGKLLGIVTSDDLFDVAEQEASEDMEKLGAMEALGERYSGISIKRLFKKRVVWLSGLFAGGLLTVAAMGSFQEKIQQQAILALFVPLIIASGGNTGTQTASLMIRALALDDVELKDWFWVMKRELTNGLMLASVLGILGLLTGVVASIIFAAEGTGATAPLTMGVAIGLAIGCVVICGAFVGSMLPFVFGKMGIDPATSSTPAVATILDVTGLVVYFLVASLVIGL